MLLSPQPYFPLRWWNGREDIASLLHHPLILCCAQCRFFWLYVVYTFHFLWWTTFLLFGGSFPLSATFSRIARLKGNTSIKSPVIWDFSKSPRSCHLFNSSTSHGSPHVQVKETNVLKPPTSVVVQQQQGRGLHNACQPSENFLNRPMESAWPISGISKFPTNKPGQSFLFRVLSLCELYSVAAECKLILYQGRCSNRPALLKGQFFNPLVSIRIELAARSLSVLTGRCWVKVFNVF